MAKSLSYIETPIVVEEDTTGLDNNNYLSSPSYYQDIESGFGGDDEPSSYYEAPYYNHYRPYNDRRY
ncbi:hypothetical protein CONCODRAFT_12194 [Conidiobolus coronatus NRRL 28638]|uniref:Uncharacterized protein n=1 Tax=Conidiobolus coronatus (strain ATCC 28846 / CBS 209.66 / NRRL 28638) TaxID=796925 RepID=A0A137NTB9_CONC2|nr:hypothetical protein CONCODRAFT_12194 [Conidiobolus coronatus NRRL 28638]|eukprot:KXN66045.1 hypothetical protein CONCODRAFT_12194 [Conidiobolus coronatus NRRL 28638]